MEDEVPSLNCSGRAAQPLGRLKTRTTWLITAPLTPALCCVVSEAAKRSDRLGGHRSTTNGYSTYADLASLSGSLNKGVGNHAW
jgi:hypothetical protein